jgi:TatD DNase family protein
VFFDTHLHLDDEAFRDRQCEVVDRALAARVTDLIAVATTAESGRAVVKLCERFPNIRAAVGIQPNYTSQATPADWEMILELARSPCAVAIGETGMDEYWDYSPLDIQRSWFERHLRLAVDLGLPFVVHLREGPHGNGSDSCCRAIYDMIRGECGTRDVRGVMHSFTGSAAWAERFLELGMYISFAGMVTFKNAQQLRETASRIPRERILIETDAPYLTPHPFRGRVPNEPAYLPYTADCLAAARGESLQDFAAATTGNAHRFFRHRPSGP